MPTTLSKTAADYVAATNAHDQTAFMACFAEDAVVHDAGHVHRGADAIRAWSEREIMQAHVTLEVLDVVERGETVTIATKVDGNFDRTGLPDPVVIEHEMSIVGERIERLTCRLAGSR